MSRLSLTFACCRYDRMEAIREGAFPIEGIDLNCITLRSGREVFEAGLEIVLDGIEARVAG